MTRKGSPPPTAAQVAEMAPDEGQVIIAIEPVDCDAAQFPAGARIVKIPFRALTRPFLAETGATVVLGALVSPQLDAMQIAERLGELGFRGTLSLLGPALPNPSLVSREIRAASGSKAIAVDLRVQP